MPYRRSRKRYTTSRRLRKPIRVLTTNRRLYKKKLANLKWKKLLCKEREAELKQEATTQSGTGIALIGAVSFDLPTTNFFICSIDAMPAQGTADINRIGDKINIKSYSIQLGIWRNGVTLPHLRVRVILFHMKNLQYYGTNFFRFGGTTGQPAAYCSVNTDLYTVLYDKTHTMNSGGFLATNNQHLPTLMIRYTIMKNREYVFEGNTKRPAKATEFVYLAILPYNLSSSLANVANVCSYQAATKVIFSD